MLSLAKSLFTLIAYSASAMAATGEFRFVPASQSTLSARVQAATVLLESTNGRCTGTYISNRGHILTARHCLQACLIQSGALEMALGPESLTYFVLNPRKLRADSESQATCQIQINSQIVRVAVRATSPGLIPRMDERSFAILAPEFYQERVADGFTSRGDFAIVQRLDWNQYPSVCLPFATKSLPVNEVVQTLSYPGATGRPDGHNSDGTQAYTSQGRVIAKIEDNECVQSTPNPSPYLMAQIQNSFNEPTALLSTLDSVYGSSGSAVLNSAQEIVGILTNVYRHSALTQQPSDEPELRYCKGSSKALKLEQIQNLLEEESFDLKQLECP